MITREHGLDALAWRVLGDQVAVDALGLCGDGEEIEADGGRWREIEGDSGR